MNLGKPILIGIIFMVGILFLFNIGGGIGPGHIHSGMGMHNGGVYLPGINYIFLIGVLLLGLAIYEFWRMLHREKRCQKCGTPITSVQWNICPQCGIKIAKSKGNV